MKITLADARKILRNNNTLPGVKVSTEFWREHVFLSSHQVGVEHLVALAESRSVAVYATVQLKTKRQSGDDGVRTEYQLLLTQEDVDVFSSLCGDQVSDLKLEVVQLSHPDFIFLPTPTYMHSEDSYNQESRVEGLKRVPALSTQLNQMGYRSFNVASDFKSIWGGSWTVDDGRVVVMGHSSIQVRSYNTAGLSLRKRAA